MDFITQNVLGAAAAQAALTKRLGWKAALLGALGGAVPDFDFLLRPLADPAFPVEFHRHFTHSIVFIPIGGLIAMLPLLIVPSIRREWKLAYLAALIGCATHALLDCCTSYGTMWFWPFTNRRIGWDLIAIIDPAFTLPLILGVIVSLRKKTATAACWALAWSVFYMGLGFVQHERALHAQRELAAARGQHIERGRAFPTLGNLLFWRSVYQADGMLWADEIMLNNFSTQWVEEGDAKPLFTRVDLPAEAKAMPRVVEVFDKLAAFSDGYMVSFESAIAGHGKAILVADARYSRDFNGFAPLWGIRIDPSNVAEPVAWSGWRTSTAEAIDGRLPR